MAQPDSRTAAAPPTRSVRTPNTIWVGLPLAILAGTLAWLALSGSSPPTLETASGLTRLDPPLELPAFALTSDDGSLLDAGKLKGQWTLLSIGFTSCPDICPNTLTLLARAVSQIEHHGTAPEVQILFVSIDPERDRPEDLRSYVKHFGRFVRAATGSHEALQQLAKPLGLFYEKAEGAATGFYAVEHSTTVLVIDPEGDVVGLLGAHGRTAQSVAAAVTSLRRESS